MERHLIDTYNRLEVRTIYGRGSKLFYYPEYDLHPAGIRNEVYYDRGEYFHPIIRYVEVGTIFLDNKYKKKGGKQLEPMENTIIGYALGTERLAMCVNECESIYQTDELMSIHTKVFPEYKNPLITTCQIIDYIRTIIFIINDGQRQDNTRRWGGLRQLIKRVKMLMVEIGCDNEDGYRRLIREIIETYSSIYSFFPDIEQEVISILDFVKILPSHYFIGEEI